MGRLAAITSVSMALFAAAFAASPAAGAEGVVPVEGPWHATTSAGLPVGFEVRSGQVVNPRWRFKWGFCGSYENATFATVPIEADGYWKYTDLRGPWIEGTFVAPDRLEGTVTAPGRSLPGCPETHASFVAEPGAAVFEQQDVVVRADVVSRRLVTEPAGMKLKRDGSMQFYEMDWQSFGDPVSRGVGHAFLREGCRRCRDKVVRRPKVVVYLNELTQQGNHRIYLHYNYRFVGSIPPGFHRNGGGLLE